MKFFVLLMLGLLTGLSAETRAEDIDEVLAYKEAPGGVVFEIVSSDPDKLEESLPQVRSAIDRLRKRFPDLSIAVVSHGKEQFALTRDNEEDHQDTHNTIKSLVADPNLSFHVCGTFAQMNGVQENEFPDYVDVAPHGPLQIKSYLELGYVKVVVD